MLTAGPRQPGMWKAFAEVINRAIDDEYRTQRLVLIIKTVRWSAVLVIAALAVFGVARFWLTR